MFRFPLSPRTRIRTRNRRVNVVKVDETGVIYFGCGTKCPMDNPRARCKLPIPNNEAHELVSSTLLGKKFFWKSIKEVIIEYNLFADADEEKDVTHDLYMNIVGTLNHHIGLPEVNHTGTCRISPVFHYYKTYVQPQPAYVDSVQYVIYLALKDKKARNIIEPARDIFIGEMYIYSKDRENYRVQLIERIEREEPMLFQQLMRNRARREREAIASTRISPRNGVSDPSVNSGSSKDAIGGKRDESDKESECEIFKWSERDPFDKQFGEEVQVSRIDYGGYNLTVHRADLYTVDSVCSKLKDIPPLAFPVVVGFLNGSAVNKRARVGELRNRKQIVDIQTVFEATEHFPKIVDIVYETESLE